MYAGTHIGRYEIRSKIGEGGMGEVFEALDRELDRRVAIKFLPMEFTEDDDRRGRFRQEAKAVSALNHPNIITIYEIGEDAHGTYLATELIEGRTLREVLKAESLTLPRILRIAEQVANALTAAHEAGIIHRDIKPENVMVRRDSIVKVLDFGLAKSREAIADPSGGNRTLPGTVMGSARYMSPEQARGIEVDERTDVWSLGVVLYETLSGTAPFDGATTADTIAAVVYKEPEPLADLLPNIPAELVRIIRKALQKDRDERYQSIKDMALDLKDLLYQIEHANSGERIGHVTSSPDFSENPTMLHRTVSGKHTTDRNATAVISWPAAAGAVRGLPARSSVIAALALVLLLALVGSGLFSLLDSPETLAANGFRRLQMSRIATDGRVSMPAISPDGKYVAYISGEVGSRSLVVRQVATDSTITLVPPTNLNIQNISFSPSGDHVYYTLMNENYTVNTLYQVPSLGGTSRRLIEDVDSAVAFSPDGGRFAFTRHVPKTNSDLVFIADSGTLELTELVSSAVVGCDFIVNRLAWSPDGERILAGAGHRQSGFLTKTDIVEIAVDTKEVRPVNTREFFTASNFAWFADGSGFIFTGRPTQNDPAQIWTADAATGEFTQLTSDPNDYMDLGITADGRSIVTIKGDTTGSIWKYSPAEKSSVQLTSDSRGIEGKSGILQRSDGSLLYTRHNGKEAELWLADADGKNGRVLYKDSGYAVEPVLTPDGRYIIFILQKDRRSRIWRANADGSEPRPLTEDAEGIADFFPQVMPDGRTVIFQRQVEGEDRYRFMKVSIDGGPAEVFYQDEHRGVFLPRISPDGKRIAFGTYEVTTFEKRLHIASLDGPNFGKIENSFPYDQVNGFMWSPGGKSLTLLSSRNGAQNLWRLPIDGSPMSPITDFTSGRIFNYQWARNGRELLIARGNVNNDLILVRDSDRPAATLAQAPAPPRRRA